MSDERFQQTINDIIAKVKVELEQSDEEFVECTFCGHGFVNEIELHNHAKTEHIDYTLSGMDLTTQVITRKTKRIKSNKKLFKAPTSNHKKRLVASDDEFHKNVEINGVHSGLDDFEESDMNDYKEYTEVPENNDDSNVEEEESDDDSDFFLIPEVKVEILEVIDEDERKDFETTVKIERFNNPGGVKDKKVKIPKTKYEQKLDLIDKQDLENLITGEKQSVLQKLRKVNGLCIKPVNNRKMKNLITYTCHVCPYETKIESEFERHLQTHNTTDNKPDVGVMSQNPTDISSKPYSCNICERKFTRKNHLKTHAVTHTGEKPYTCDICQRKFAQKSHLNTHQSTHTGVKPFNCNICERKFSRKCDLNTHSRIHVGKKNFDCEVCGKKFLRKSNLESHSRTHTGVKPYSCDICHQRFSQNGNLTAHKIIHTGFRPFACDLCERKFSLKSQLKLHIKIHAEGKLFECDVCGHRFSTKCYLEKHRVIHTGEKPYSCEICERRFTRKTHLMRHSRTHTGEKPFPCDICGLKLSDRSTLIAHKRKLHSNEQCNYLY